MSSLRWRQWGCGRDITTGNSDPFTRVGQVVHLTGFLVNGVRDDGAYITTSLTRSDTGPGSCEVVLVEQLEAW